MLATALAAARLAMRSAPVLLVAQMAVAVAMATLPVLTAWLTKLVIDTLVGGAAGGLEPLLWAAGGLMGAGLMMALLPRLTSFLEQESGRAIALRVQDRLYRAV